jgi:hypothetical protein
MTFLLNAHSISISLVLIGTQVLFAWEHPVESRFLPKALSMAGRVTSKSPILSAGNPAYCQELDWIITETIRRHLHTIVDGPESPESNTGRSAVIIRCVTRALEQKEMLKRLKQHKRFAGKSDADILEVTRKDCLQGGYYLVDYRGYEGYRASENVVQLFTMGALVTEALIASDKLREQGIYANVIQVSSNDLLLGNLAEKNNYHHLRQNLEITGDLHVRISKEAQAATRKAANGSYPPALHAPQLTDTFSANAAGAAQLMSWPDVVFLS